MAWFKMSEWEWWNKLALVMAVLLGSLLLLTRPLVWKADASRLGIIVFVPLAMYCVRWLLRWPANGGQGGAGAHNKFKSKYVARDVGRVAGLRDDAGGGKRHCAGHIAADAASFSASPVVGNTGKPEWVQYVGAGAGERYAV